MTSGRTQADAGAALGIVGSSYGDFERGTTIPSLRQIRTLAVVFDVPLSLLTDPPESDEDRIDRVADRAGKPSRRTLLTVEEDDENDDNRAVSG